MHGKGNRACQKKKIPRVTGILKFHLPVNPLSMHWTADRLFHVSAGKREKIKFFRSGMYCPKLLIPDAELFIFLHNAKLHFLTAIVFCRHGRMGKKHFPDPFMAAFRQDTKIV